MVRASVRIAGRSSVHDDLAQVMIHCVRRAMSPTMLFGRSRSDLKVRVENVPTFDIDLAGGLLHDGGSTMVSIARLMPITWMGMPGLLQRRVEDVPSLEIQGGLARDLIHDGGSATVSTATATEGTGISKGIGVRDVPEIAIHGDLVGGLHGGSARTTPIAWMRRLGVLQGRVKDVPTLDIDLAGGLLHAGGSTTVAMTGLREGARVAEGEGFEPVPENGIHGGPARGLIHDGGRAMARFARIRSVGWIVMIGSSSSSSLKHDKENSREEQSEGGLHLGKYGRKQMISDGLV